MEDEINYKEIEALFERLFSELKPVLSESEYYEVYHFFDVGEYGLAVETLISILDEERIEKTTLIEVSIERLKFIMEL